MKPVRRLNTVVLPAPFGPSTPVIEPAIQIERDVLDGMQATEALVEPFDLQKRRHGSIRRTRCHAGAISPCGMKNRMNTSSSV